MNQSWVSVIYKSATTWICFWRSCCADNADSDDNSETHDSEGSGDYYQPISAVDDDDSEEDGFPNGDSTPSGPAADLHGQDLCNGYPEGGMDLKEEDNGSSTEEEEEERAASESAMWRAFREDENRRNSPLPRENATRIMDAMRGISLQGFTPDWANRVSEPRWIDTLARLRRQPPPPPSSATATAAPTITRN